MAFVTCGKVLFATLLNSVRSLSLHSVTHGNVTRAYSEVAECFEESVVHAGWPRIQPDWLSIVQPDWLDTVDERTDGVAALQKFVADQSSCVMAKKTTWSSITRQNKEAGSNACRRCYQTYDGEFNIESGFEPDKRCECGVDVARQSWQGLFGKTIVFVGDSMARQIFLRAIGLLRGQEQVFDHYFHCDADYTFDSSGDCLHVSCIRDAPCLPKQTQHAGAMKFIWAQSEQKEHKMSVVERLSSDPSIDAVVVMSGYWFDANNKAPAREGPLPQVFFLSIPDNEGRSYSEFNKETANIIASHSG